jgi:hypothetical protein
LRRLIVFCVLMGVLIVGWLRWRELSSPRKDPGTSGVTIDKQPVTLANRTFDPGNPPEDMPPLASGENAACDSNFLSKADVGGEARQTDATHATVTITHVKVTLQLNITIWLPADPSQHVIEHEEGHRQISEYYYQTADKLAERIAATYMGKQVVISRADLNAQLGKFLEQSGTDITSQYNNELNPEPTQLRYDTITDHARNQVNARDAVAEALKDVAIASAHPVNPDQDSINRNGLNRSLQHEPIVSFQWGIGPLYRRKDRCQSQKRMPQQRVVS